ncbi:Parg, partial [Symbiodinium necroappetens]
DASPAFSEEDRHRDSLFQCVTLIFGARVSSFHCARAAGLLLRLLKCFVNVRHSGLIYVQDFLSIFNRLSAPLWASVIVALLLCIKVSMRTRTYGSGSVMVLTRAWCSLGPSELPLCRLALVLCEWSYPNSDTFGFPLVGLLQTIRFLSRGALLLMLHQLLGTGPEHGYSVRIDHVPGISSEVFQVDRTACRCVIVLGAVPLAGQVCGSMLLGPTAHEQEPVPTVAANYEDRKRSFQDTDTLCRGQGLQFVPLVAEATGGGWGPTAVKTWRELGGLYAARLGLTASEGTEQLLQSLSVTLQRENARAVLRRLPEAGEEGRGPLLEP